MRKTLFTISAACAALMLSSAAIQADEFDLSPKVDSNNKIVLDAFEDATEEAFENVRVFAYEFGEIPEQPYFLPDPGFHPLPGSGFAPGSLVGFQLAAPLQYWAGAGAPAFAPVASGESIRLGFGADAVVSSGGAVPSPAGFQFGVIDASGEFDDHLETYLLGSGGTIANPGSPAEGIYLLTLQVTSSTAGITASDPVYLLFTNGELEGELLQAALFVRDTFAPGTTVLVPEPASLTALASLALVRRRR